MASRALLSAFITIAIFVVAVCGKDSPNSELAWGHTSNNCDTEYITKPTNSKTYRTSSSNPIVGLFATRFEKSNAIWGTGALKGTSLAKKECYQSSRVYYSVVSGTSTKPTVVDVTFGTKTREFCSWGYTMKVCYKD